MQTRLNSGHRNKKCPTNRYPLMSWLLTCWNRKKTSGTTKQELTDERDYRYSLKITMWKSICAKLMPQDHGLDVDETIIAYYNVFTYKKSNYVDKQGWKGELISNFSVWPGREPLGNEIFIKSCCRSSRRVWGWGWGRSLGSEQWAHGVVFGHCIAHLIYT